MKKFIGVCDDYCGVFLSAKDSVYEYEYASCYKDPGHNPNL